MVGTMGAVRGPNIRTVDPNQNLSRPDL